MLNDPNLGYSAWALGGALLLILIAAALMKWYALKGSENRYEI